MAPILHPTPRALALLWSLLVGCPGDKATTKDGSTDTACVACADLIGMPCHMGLDADAAYDYCDPCGKSWRCALTGAETTEYLEWGVSDVPCSCITADGYRDTAEPGCAPVTDAPHARDRRALRGAP